MGFPGVFHLPKPGYLMKSNKLTYAAYPKLPDGPFGQYRLREHLKNEVPVVEGILVRWPVMVTFYLEEDRRKQVSPEVRLSYEPGLSLLERSS